MILADLGRQLVDRVAHAGKYVDQSCKRRRVRHRHSVVSQARKGVNLPSVSLDLFGKFIDVLAVLVRQPEEHEQVKD